MFIALFFLSSFITEGTFANKINMKSIVTQDAYALEPQLIQLNIKDLTFNKTGENTAGVKITFAAHNPQTYTVLLDGIHYNIYVNNQTVSSGDIGSEALIDVMREEPEFPIISNSTVTLKNTQTIHTSEIKNDISSIITAGKACFTVNGTYFYRQVANLAASGGANEFQLKFPDGCR